MHISAYKKKNKIVFKNAVTFKKEKVCPQIESNQGKKNIMCDIASGVTYSAIQVLSLFNSNVDHHGRNFCFLFVCEILL